MGFLENYKNALEGKAGSSYFVSDKKVKCPICDSVTFESSKVQLNTTGMTFLGLDWANKNAQVLICTECSYILWFQSEPARTSD